jgi:uncharacterized protein
MLTRASKQTARVRVAQPLRFLLTARNRNGDVEVSVDGASSLVHVIESLGVPRTEIGEVRLAGKPVGLHVKPRGGDLIEVLQVRRPQPIANPRFVLDAHLGALARRMRLLGLDVAYYHDVADADLVALAAAEQRILLTRDRGLLRRRTLPSGAYVYGNDPDDQLMDVLHRFDPPLVPWTRCLVCNGLLEPVEKGVVQHLLQPGTRRSYDQFARCRACRRLYWRGAHARRLEAIVARAEERGRG